MIQDMDEDGDGMISVLILIDLRLVLEFLETSSLINSVNYTRVRVVQ